jgi:2,5-diketo-D-gluconate reductase A
MKLNNTSRNALGMPMIGFGTYQMSIQQAEESVYTALTTGFRHIDSAQGYNNEEGTGKAIEKWLKEGGKREDLFVTTKLWPGYAAWGMPEADYDSTIDTCQKQLKELQVDYIDLYLIHGPLSSKRIQQWKAICELKKMGIVKHIGVSNYNGARLQEIEDAGLEMPEANEIEFHPLSQQKEVTALMKEKGIFPVAYSSLATLSTWRTGEGQGGEHKVDMKAEAQKVQAEIAQRLGISEAALLLRWGMERGYAALTKSTKPERIQENLNVYGFDLSEDDIAKLDALDQNEYVAWAQTGMNPMTVEVPLEK